MSPRKARPRDAVREYLEELIDVGDEKTARGTFLNDCMKHGATKRQAEMALIGLEQYNAQEKRRMELADSLRGHAMRIARGVKRERRDHASPILESWLDIAHDVRMAAYCIETNCAPPAERQAA